MFQFRLNRPIYLNFIQKLLLKFKGGYLTWILRYLILSTLRPLIEMFQLTQEVASGSFPNEQKTVDMFSSVAHDFHGKRAARLNFSLKNKKKNARVLPSTKKHLLDGQCFHRTDADEWPSLRDTSKESDFFCGGKEEWHINKQVQTCLAAGQAANGQFSARRQTTWIACVSLGAAKKKKGRDCCERVAWISPLPTWLVSDSIQPILKCLLS